MHRHHSTAPTASAGLIMSLASELPKSSPLYRQAQRTANRIQRPHDRQWDHRAAEVIARLITATDTPESADYDQDGLLSPSFDD